jgi:hypothetical protein
MEAGMSKLQLKEMMIVFFDIGGKVIIEWIPEGQTVDQKYHLKVLTKPMIVLVMYCQQ